MECVRIAILLVLVWRSVISAIAAQENYADSQGYSVAVRVLEVRKILQHSNQQEVELDTETSTVDSVQPDESASVLVADETQPNSQIDSAETVEESLTVQEGQAIEGSEQTEELSSAQAAQSDAGDENTGPQSQESDSEAGAEENQGQSTSENESTSFQWLKESLELLTQNEPAAGESTVGTPGPAPSLADSSPAQQGASDDYYANRFRATQENDITELDIDKESFPPPPTTVLTVTGRDNTAQNEQQNESPAVSFG